MISQYEKDVVNFLKNHWMHESLQTLWDTSGNPDWMLYVYERLPQATISGMISIKTVMEDFTLNSSEKCDAIRKLIPRISHETTLHS